MRRVSRSTRGFTLVELLVVMATIAIVIGALAMILFQFLNIPRWGNAQLAVDGDLRNAGLWLMRDGNEAWQFTTGVSPVYGTFAITHTGNTTATVTYRYSAGAVRRDYQTAMGTTTTDVARHIKQESDVTFAPSGDSVVVEVTATSGTGKTQVSASQVYTVTMRVQ